IENNQNEQYNSIPTNDSRYPIVLITEVPESIDSDNPINISSNDDSNNDESVSTSSNDPSSEKSIQKEKGTNYIRKKIFKEKDTPESIENNQNEQKSKRKSDYDSREQDKGKKVELSESSSDSDELQVEKTYDKKKKLSCGMNGDIFSSNKDPKDLQGMFSQRIDFNEGSTSISLEPLPKHLQA
ncbi:10813_t:CDS:2, partial [Gigaspora margarita]